MRVFEAISAYFMRELVERVYPFLMFLFFTFSLLRSVPMEWALQKLKSLVLRVLAIIFLIGLYQDVKAQQLQSSWLSGDTNSQQIPVFGHLKGEPVAPGSMAWHSAWTDSAGDLYVFGGVSFSGSGLNPNNRLFKYSQGTWRWIGGDSLNAAFNPSVGGFSGGEATFGTQGVASPSNQPGARYLGTYWQGPNHEFYLYGGIGMGSGGQFGLLSDLWVYKNGMWTWLSGSSSVNSMPVHGTQYQEASNNNPGSRIGAMAWSDDQGNSYVFGGQSLFGNQSDVMKWDGSNWTWIAGPSTANQPGSIALNQPAARRFAAICKTPDSTVYLHGGEQGGNSTRFGDLWTWNGSGWDHLDGAITPLASISYSGSQSPGDRSDHQLFYIDSTLYLFGGLHSINGGNSLESRADFWSWKSGSWSLLRASSPNDVGSYGQLMQSSSTVFPASISNGTAVNVGNGVYFFGGRRNGTSNFVDDLFYFDGHQFQYLYGSEGLADMPEIYDLGEKAVHPGSIEKAAFNFDVSSGHLFVFGGKQYYRDGSTALSNTLWSYDGLNWIWEKGDSLASSLPTYGTQGVSAMANNPGAREEAVLWEDGNGLLWLFGGFGLDVDGDYGYLNDLWSYDYTNWTWVSGSKQANDLGSYGAKGQSSPNIYPGGRRSMEVWVDADFRFSGDGTIELSGDLFNYGENAWQGDWEITSATQSQIFGDTLEVQGVLLVDEEASFKTNGLLRIKASNGSNFGQLLNFGDVIGELDFEYYLDLGSDSIDNGRYFYLGLVLDSVEIEDLNQGGLLNSGQANSSLNTVWQWNGSTASWESPAIHSTVSAGSGLAIYAGNRNSYNFLFPNGKSAVLRIRGYARNNASLSRVLNYNDGQNSTASFVGGTSKSATEGWNLLANPFSHNVDVEQILSGFRRKSIYVWDGSDYRSFVNGVSVNGGSSLLAPGQAFYYQTVDQLQRTSPNDFTF